MKKMIKLATFALALGFVGCQDKLDATDGDITTGTGSVSLFMNTKTAIIKIEKSTEGGETTVELRTSALANQDVKATVSVVDFLKEYNATNSTRFRLLPISEYELFEADNPKNVSTNGTLVVTIKAGTASERIGVRVKPLDEKSYPVGINYSIPLQLVASTAKQVLSNNQAVVSFERPFKTSVAKIKQGYAFAVSLDPAIENTDEVTVQGQFMWEKFHPYSGNTINMTLMNIGAYTRIFPDQLQVKDGGGDNPDDKAPYNFAVNKWHQITFTYKDSYFKVYVDGKLIHTFQRTGIGISDKLRTIGVESARTSYSTNRYFREFRLWNRALTEAEIAANVYLPVDPNSEGLIAYVPVTEETKFEDKSKYKNKVIFAKGTGSPYGVQDGPGWQEDIDADTFNEQLEWTKNVKFPAPAGHSGLYIEN